MTLQLASHVSLSQTDDGAVLLDERTGSYWQLNGSGCVALRALLSGEDVSGAVQLILDRHDVDPDEARRDVAALVRELSHARLVVPA
jgi:hypothetical protein